MERSIHGEHLEMQDIANWTDEQLIEKELELKKRLEETIVTRQIVEINRLLELLSFEVLYRLGELAKETEANV